MSTFSGTAGIMSPAATALITAAWAQRSYEWNRNEGQITKCVPADLYRSHSSISVLQPGGGGGEVSFI